MKLKFLGTGTSQGIPVIGCTCHVCTSNDPKDNRFRSSAMLITDQGNHLLIDCGPDFRMQMLQQQLGKVDAVLLTHEHNDHVMGLDDLRPIIFTSGKDATLYCQERVAKDIIIRFAYAFAEVRYPGSPSFEINVIEDKSLTIFDAEIIPIHVMHGKLPIVGFKVNNSAYITDASYIPPKEKDKLKNLDCLIINCIRKTDVHTSHFILPDIIELQEELNPKKIFLTHISHHFGIHELEDKQLPKNIHLSYDGLTLDL